jgi:hypothetical protein
MEHKNGPIKENFIAKWILVFDFELFIGGLRPKKS